MKVEKKINRMWQEWNSMTAKMQKEIRQNAMFIKVLDFLMTYRGFDYSLTSIAKESRIGWKTLRSFLPKLIRLRQFDCKGCP